MIRVGVGYDVHALVVGNELNLCGVSVPYALGLDGHSDADVALHALCDALLGAAALGDIGKHFPDTDSEYMGISSLVLLERVRVLLNEEEYEPGNVDLTIVAQKPKLAPYIPEMIKRISGCLKIPSKTVNVKATTTERLGFTGREEGIAAYAVCTINPKQTD